MARFIKIASYNLRGLCQGKQQLLELCNSHDIIAIQEHWLSECDMDKLHDLHDEFSVIARSAMSDKSIRHGRFFTWKTIWWPGTAD